MENKFNVYGEYGCQLKSGKEIKLGRSISCNQKNIQEDLETVLSMENHEAILEALQKEEKEKFDFLNEHLDDWQKVAEKVMVLQLAHKYEEDCKKVEAIETTHNEWIESKDGSYWTEFKISNKTYTMTIRIYENTTYKNGVDIPCNWQVSYWLSTNNIKDTYSDCKRIASIDRKVFEDKEAAYKYVEGRKKFFSKYFKEEYQPIDAEYVEYFKSCGKLLRGYTVA